MRQLISFLFIFIFTADAWPTTKSCQAFYYGEKVELFLEPGSALLSSPREIYNDFKIQSWLERSLIKKDAIASYRLRRFFSIPAVRAVLDPLGLFVKKDANLPEDLRAKINSDGALLHWPEVQQHYFNSNQPRIDNWNHALLSLRLILTAVSLQLGAQHTVAMYNEIKIQEGQAVVHGLKTMQTAFDDLEAQLDREFEARKYK